jgi:hypothetical protein
MSHSRSMNDRHVISVQLDADLRKAFAAFVAGSAASLGRKVTEAEALRVLLRKALETGVSLSDSAYREGFRAGMAASKEAFARGMAAAKKHKFEAAGAPSV